MELRFEWDADKAAENARKHGVTFEEAGTVFADPLSLTVIDPRHSQGEVRLAILGQSARGRLLVVVHTDRGRAPASSAHAQRPAASGAPMSTAPSEPEPADADEPLPEYDFRGGERGKYAARYAAGTNVVVLDPDVAAVYPTAEAVNSALRALAEVARRQAGRAAA